MLRSLKFLLITKIWSISQSHISWLNNRWNEQRNWVSSTFTSSINLRRKKLSQMFSFIKNRTYSRTETLIILITRWCCWNWNCLNKKHWWHSSISSAFQRFFLTFCHSLSFQSLNKSWIILSVNQRMILTTLINSINQKIRFTNLINWLS